MRKDLKNKLKNKLYSVRKLLKKKLTQFQIILLFLKFRVHKIHPEIKFKWVLKKWEIQPQAWNNQRNK